MSTILGGIVFVFLGYSCVQFVLFLALSPLPCSGLFTCGMVLDYFMLVCLVVVVVMIVFSFQANFGILVVIVMFDLASGIFIYWLGLMMIILDIPSDRSSTMTRRICAVLIVSILG